ncbi:MAG: hypothetical protein JWM44_3567 [Bacilli bacterium]|nr:hypothetical protein [Bacilli bacterium]
MKSVGEKIKFFRKKINMSQQEFSLSINISQGNLSEIEKNNSKPSADTLIAIWKKYGVDLNWLLIDELEQSYIQNQDHLNIDEIKLISLFRKLNSQGKSEIFDYITFKANKYE